MPRVVLQSPRFRPLPLGSVQGRGWLARQLRLQADGLSGHLDEFWPDIRDSQWFGGTSEGWERAPYWLDGLIPLAWTLDDAALKAKARRYMEQVLAGQQEDGWLGPRAMVQAAGAARQEKYDLWGQLLAMKVLAQWHDATGDDRALTALERALRKIDRHIDVTTLFDWGESRWFEGLVGLWYLYERTGEAWLVDLAVKLHAQGLRWPALLERWPYTEATPKGRWSQMSHVVNNAMMLKSPALWWRLTGEAADREAAARMIELLDRHHGMVTGVFTGDECLAGLSPSQGTELCAVVEYLYSLEVLLGVLGDAALGDRLERIAFNALPATFSPDMWSHQYDQQVNQVECSSREGRTWNTNGPDANLFGVEPNYGCCTANLSQGWPKFASHLWRATADGGLAALAYAPCHVRAEIGGAAVEVEVETDYPFRDTIAIRVTAGSAEVPVELRIPHWAAGATVRVGGAAEPAEAGTFHRVSCRASATTEIELRLPMRAQLVARQRGAVALERGPLIYALRIGEDWRRVHEDAPYRELPHADWEVYAPTPWNYALEIDERTADEVTFTERPVGERPFSPDGAPVEARVRGRRVPEWAMVNGSAADPPPSPVRTAEPVEELTLIPYGATNLRVAEFPVAARP